MILIGQYDSPFVRRTAIAMKLYGLEFEHRPWSTFGDADKIRPFSPLTRVPVLVLADGDTLIDSHTIIDFVDGLVSPDRRLAPEVQPARRQVFKVVSLATGFADKAVSLFYELVLHDQALQAQVAGHAAWTAGDTVHVQTGPRGVFVFAQDRTQDLLSPAGARPPAPA